MRSAEEACVCVCRWLKMETKEEGRSETESGTLPECVCVLNQTSLTNNICSSSLSLSHLSLHLLSYISLSHTPQALLMSSPSTPEHAPSGVARWCVLGLASAVYHTHTHAHNKRTYGHLDRLRLFLLRPIRAGGGKTLAWPTTTKP